MNHTQVHQLTRNSFYLSLTLIIIGTKRSGYKSLFHRMTEAFPINADLLDMGKVVESEMELLQRGHQGEGIYCTSSKGVFFFKRKQIKSLDIVKSKHILLLLPKGKRKKKTTTTPPALYNYHLYKKENKHTYKNMHTSHSLMH